ncbi:MAG: Gfo/Idh/MocA family oxidoreductase [Balneolaceae bacterium]|nr:Gfo/Idh/MocA family oxidoreductase [Balneolaceae bacterium]MBO6545645.1 Gfo/Idh/MocA family oxidoreductase [Balneolaceae bacterium]MBO6647041.1 Gfo/Idh/MocA family oxidoreductase [Balneolaceae bacterium]
MPISDSTSKDKSQSRKQFLKNVGLAGAAFTILPRHVLGGPGYIAPSDTLYIAGIGAGGKGTSNLANFAEHPNAKIAFLCDVDDRMATRSRESYPEAPYFKDYREMLDKEHQNIDAVCVSTPDHNHAVQTMAAIQLGKHVFVEKPLTHDIYEARMLTEAAEKYKVVTQMGNQGASGDGVRQLIDWCRAGVIGDVHEVWVWTDRPVWPQGIPWPEKSSPVPDELSWDLWLGTAPYKEYVDGLAPFNWRGWWNYGTGALGDMACHLMEAPFTVLELGYPEQVECSVGSVFTGPFQRGYFPDSCPPSSHIVLRFPEMGGKSAVKMHWMDGGIQPERPEELGPNEVMGDGGNGVLMIGDKGKMMCSTYGQNPRLLPTSLTETTEVPQTIDRVPEGHYQQWVKGCLAGYGNMKMSSSFDVAGPLTESILMGNLAIRSYDIQERYTNENGEERTRYPGRNIQLLWDGPNMRITNFEPANQFVKREYREGWG